MEDDSELKKLQSDWLKCLIRKAQSHQLSGKTDLFQETREKLI